MVDAGEILIRGSFVNIWNRLPGVDQLASHILHQIQASFFALVVPVFEMIAFLDQAGCHGHFRNLQFSGFHSSPRRLLLSMAPLCFPFC